MDVHWRTSHSSPKVAWLVCWGVDSCNGIQQCCLQCMVRWQGRTSPQFSMCDTKTLETFFSNLPSSPESLIKIAACTVCLCSSFNQVLLEWQSTHYFLFTSTHYFLFTFSYRFQSIQLEFVKTSNYFIVTKTNLVR